MAGVIGGSRGWILALEEAVRIDLRFGGPGISRILAGDG